MRKKKERERKKKERERKKKGRKREKKREREKKKREREKKKGERERKKKGEREREKKKRERERKKKGERERKYVPLLLPGWMECTASCVGQCEVLTLLTASGRSDESHRPAPRQHHSTLMPTKTAGRVGRAKKLPHSSPKGALTTTRPLLVNARPTGETCAKNFADTCYTAWGPRAGSKRSGIPGETTLHNQGPGTVLRDRTCNTTKRSCGTGLAS